MDLSKFDNDDKFCAVRLALLRGERGPLKAMAAKLRGHAEPLHSRQSGRWHRRMLRRMNRSA
jgi:hypothetical protein